MDIIICPHCQEIQRVVLRTDDRVINQIQDCLKCTDKKIALEKQRKAAAYSPPPPGAHI